MVYGVDIVTINARRMLPWYSFLVKMNMKNEFLGKISR